MTDDLGAATTNHAAHNSGATESEMSSANGFELQVGKHTLRATWPAPYFVFVPAWSDDDRPLLIHCDDLAHAQMHAACGGVLLDSTFQKLN